MHQQELQTSLEHKDEDTFGDDFEFDFKDDKNANEPDTSAQEKYVNSFLDQQNRE